MGPAGFAILSAALLVCGGDRAAPRRAYLYQPSYCLDDRLRGPALGYVARPGDVMITADRNVLWWVLFHAALTARPYHCAVFVARSDGRLATLEAGPHDSVHVELLDAEPNLRYYEEHGLVWIRRRRVPLTAAQSARLTDFAEAQAGKHFALCRLVAQITPLRTRGPLRTACVGMPHGDRAAYFCSELVLEACVAAGLLDAATIRPSATYPRDLFLDRSLNPYINGHPPLAPDWDPPARWTSVSE